MSRQGADPLSTPLAAAVPTSCLKPYFLLKKKKKTGLPLAETSQVLLICTSTLGLTVPLLEFWIHANHHGG